ncbi:hypothetical protein ACFL1H_02060 [Nanoarchaeota archaeon]
MGFYKIIRYCRICKVKFFVEKASSPKYYCETCKKKYKNDN